MLKIKSKAERVMTLTVAFSLCRLVSSADKNQRSLRGVRCLKTTTRAILLRGFCAVPILMPLSPAEIRTRSTQCLDWCIFVIVFLFTFSLKHKLTGSWWKSKWHKTKCSLARPVHNEEVSLTMWGVPLPGEVCGVETLSPPWFPGVSSAFFPWPPALDSSGGSAPQTVRRCWALLTEIPMWFPPPPCSRAASLCQSQLADSSQRIRGFAASLHLPTDCYCCLQSTPWNFSRAVFFCCCWLTWVPADAAEIQMKLVSLLPLFFSENKPPDPLPNTIHTCHSLSGGHMLNMEGIQSKHGHRWHGVMCCLSSSAKLTNCSNLNLTVPTAQLGPHVTVNICFICSISNTLLHLQIWCFILISA